MIQKDKFDLVIGVDPGINVGFSIWNRNNKQLDRVSSVMLCEFFKEVEELNKTYTLLVRVENPNTWVPFKGAKRDNSRLQGAGAVKQTYKHIIEFLEKNNIEFESTRLQGSVKKLSSEEFKKITGWTKQSNEHARDSSMLCYNF